MARIVCQVLHQSDRVTFIWSEGTSTFAPYHLRGTQAENFRRLAARVQERLAEFSDQAALAEVGGQLQQAIFPDDIDAARAVRDWLSGLEARHAIDSLEIVTDEPGFVPWNIVGASTETFWGMSKNLVTGRRVNAWRQVPLLEKPAILCVTDPVLRDALADEDKRQLTELAAAHSLEIVESRAGLEMALRDQGPDFVYVFCRTFDKGFHLGNDVVTPAELQDWLDAGAADAAGPLVFINACRLPGGESTAGMTPSLDLDGLIRSEQPAPLNEGHRLGLDFLARFLWGGESLNAALRNARAAVGPAGLLYSAFCPGHLHVAWSEDTEPADFEAPDPLPLPDEPYRPLSPYDREQQSLFTGREDDVAEFASLLDRSDTRLAIVHGGSGVGKASFLRAGVLPWLEDWSIGYRALRDRTEEESPVAERDYPVLSIRASQDLAGQIAEALCAYCDQPLVFTTPVGATVTIDLPQLLRTSLSEQVALQEAIQPADVGLHDTVRPGVTISGTPPPLPAGHDKVTPVELWESMQNDVGLLARALDRLAGSLPYEPVILIEQGEELFTQAAKPVDRQRRRLALQMLARFAEASSRCKVIYSLRTEFLGQLLDELPYRQGLKSFFVEELADEEIVAAMLLPTADEPLAGSDDIPREKYHFDFEQGLPREILKVVRSDEERREGLLASVQAVCAQLVESTSSNADHVVTSDDLRRLVKKGKGMSGLGVHVERILERALPNPADRRAFKALAAELVARTPEEIIYRKLMPLEDLESLWKGYSPFQDMLDRASDAALLEINQLLVGGKQRHYGVLAQDALAQLAVGWTEQKKRQQAARARTSDLLWIFLPLLFLASAIAYYFFNRQSDAATGDTFSKAEVQAFLKQQQELTDSLLYPLHTGRVGLAQTALESGNVLRARQVLMGQLPGKTDRRGFEWHYLWKRCQPERHALLGHIAQVTSVALSPDEKLAASASVDGTVKIWDTTTGQIQINYQGHPAPILAVTFSGDGKTVASAGADGKVHLWDVGESKDYATRKEPGKVLAGHQGAILGLAFAPKENLLASASEDKTVVIWDLAKDDKKILKDHGSPVTSVAFSPDGKALASAGTDGVVLIWDPATGKKVHTLKGHAGPIQALAFAPDGKLLASGGSERRESVDLGVVRFWDPATGKPASDGGAPKMVHSQGILALAFIADGKTLASGGKDNEVRLWDPASGESRGAISGHLGWVSALAAKGHTIVTGSFDQSVRLWDDRNSTNPAVLVGHKDWVCSVAFSADDRLLASGSRDGTVKLWDPSDGKMLQTLDVGAPVMNVAFTPGQGLTKLAAATWKEGKGEVVLWDTARDKTGVKVKELHRLTGHKGGVASVAFSLDAEHLASAGEDKTIRIWEVSTGKPGQVLSAHRGTVRCLAFSPDNETLTSGGDDRLILFWNWKAGKLTAEPIIAHTAAVTALTYFPAGAGVLASAGNDRTVILWKADNREYLGTFRGHANGILALAAGPRGDSFMSAGWDRDIKLWNPQPGQDERFTFIGHQGPVRSLAISGDGLTLASASHDGTIRLWRAAAEKAMQKHE